jgi:hypothetical protein
LLYRLTGATLLSGRTVADFLEIVSADSAASPQMRTA